jgi:hypothetical protein
VNGLGLLAVLAACHRPLGVRYDVPVREPEVRYRPGEPSDDAERTLVASVPRGRWDEGLAAAASELLSLSTDPAVALDPHAQALALARAGFPAQARFTRFWNGGAYPSEVDAMLAADIALAAENDESIDVALARRTWADGTALWVIGWARHVASIDPIPRALAIDAPLALRVDHPKGGPLRLVLAPPMGAVEELDMTSGVSRWVDRFHVPGAYRLEVLRTEGAVAEVVFLFTLWVDTPPEEPALLGESMTAVADPVAAESVLFQRLDALRRARGLGGVQRFDAFLPVIREHSAYMASTGVVAHQIPGVTDGVAARIQGAFHPRPVLHEDVAAAASAASAAALVEDSPAHLQNLLCEACTHAVVGVALEPVLDRAPRLFVTWELIEFPNGPSRPVDHYNR